MNASSEQMTGLLDDCIENSPFLLENEGEYQAWRLRKLEYRRRLPADRIFDLDQDGRLPEASLEAAGMQIQAHNFLLFQSPRPLDKAGFLALNRQAGLLRLDQNPGADEDRVTSLRVVASNDDRALYIPYTNRAMNWHTDGYYNPIDRAINAFALYCVHQAHRGGGNTLFDHEMMYLLLRDREPELLEALMHPRMMQIPPNVQDNRIVRAQETGPVFAISPGGCSLLMRYTSRPRHIVWKSDRRSQRALDLVREILVKGEAAAEVRLAAGQGLICNNVLHGRQAFHDADGQPQRLIYRARYYDAIRFDSAD